MTSPTAKPRVRWLEQWTTIAFSALAPGWANVYACDGVEERNACPGVLIQEHRSTLRLEDIPTGSDPPYRLARKEENLPQPFEIRVVFADFDGAELCPANDAGNYKRTDPPGGFA